jgi:glycosyltransferase involved in cell wall biosynthesis
MNKVAIVVQRSHPDIAGGSEALARHYATLLHDKYQVEVLTTTAFDTSEWANTLPAGPETKDGVTTIRFPVTIGRSHYWSGLHRRLLEALQPFAPTKDSSVPQIGWTIALQEEFIRHQGPYSAPLMQFIREHWRDYRSMIFITYLYPTTYFGLQQLPAGRALFSPTLHDEIPAYLPVYKDAAHRAGELIWLTAAESRVGQKLWGDLKGRIVAMAIESELREPRWAPAPYLLYCGRVDPNKGCKELFEYFITYKKARPGNLRLIITGIDDMPVPAHPEIEFRGFVSAEEKFALMAGATVFVQPSPNESFSIVILEAMAQLTPVLANSASGVLADHVKDSGAGRAYDDYPSFARALDELTASEETRKRMGERGREYVLAKYQTENVREKLIEAVESCTVSRSANAGA